MGRAKKNGESKRERKSFTTLPKVVRHIDKMRRHMDFSEYVHRLCVADYNKHHPKDPIKVWEPEEDE